MRRATRSDLDAVLALDLNSSVVHSHAELLTARIESGEVLIFERDAQLLGFAITTARSFFGFDFVELLSVDAEARRTGVGSSLLSEASSHSSTNRIFISTNQSNRPMIALLKNAAWHFSGKLEGIDEGDPELIYYKDVR